MISVSLWQAVAGLAGTALLALAIGWRFAGHAYRDRLERLEEEACSLLAQLSQSRKQAADARDYYQHRWQQLREARDLARAQAMAAEEKLAQLLASRPEQAVSDNPGAR